MAEKSAEMTGKGFFETLVRWIVALPTDIKVLVEMIGDNELDMKARSLAVGALLYLVASVGLIPNQIPVLGYVDDVLVLHIALALILQTNQARGQYYREKYPVVIGRIDEEVELLTNTLGALYSWLRAFVENLIQRRYKGKSTEETAGSAEAREEIFDEAMVYAANVNVDEAAIRQKLIASPPDRLIKLLSDGLEKEQARQQSEERTSPSNVLTDGMTSVRRLFGERKRDE